MPVHKLKTSKRETTRAVSNFAAEFLRTAALPLVYPVTKLGGFAVDAIEGHMDPPKSATLRMTRHRLGGFVDRHLMPERYPHERSRMMGQHIAKYAGCLVLGAACGLGLQGAWNAVKAPKDGDQVIGLSSCAKKPRLWLNKTGEYVVVVPKGCTLQK